MLQLQRASAGSGKTYMLAKKFIEYLISVKEENAPRRLRSTRELRDSLQHILAITFTNKATNEMKLRIVAKLDALGSWTPDIPTKKVDYLDEFTEKFSAAPEEIARICRTALRILLTDYGDFKVSTIDSFFQTVLRTFAFEADLDDTYQLELDSDYVARIGLDTTLDDLESAAGNSQDRFWIDKMIREQSATGKGWNIFQKKDTSGIYAKVLKASRNLDKEDFKTVREQLDAYFERNPDFFATFHTLSDIYERKLKESFLKMRKEARALLAAFSKLRLDIDKDGGTYLAGRARKMASGWNLYDSAGNAKDTAFAIPEFTRKGATKRVFRPGTDNPWLDTDTEDQVEETARRMYAAFDEWRTEARSAAIGKWIHYRKTLPYLGLLQSVRNNSRLFLTDSNTIELGETNSILHRIIGDDDAPFVYERIGSRLNHFLIDEFQDTSRLQWSNLRPLVAESEGRGNDNLIIGDAKQSIYRFRNADPSLITSRVPEEFARTCFECGNTPKENTNWRSSRRIVEFNNLFFRNLTRELSADMERLYTNTVQPPHHTDDKGYVKLQLCAPSPGSDMPPHFNEIPQLISDMLDRGYRQKDIAILVDKNKDGQAMIAAIMNHNHLPDSRHKIDFISAESLKIGESQAVQTIVSVLEVINKGTHAELRAPEERRTKGIGDWSKLKADFSYFAMSHPEMTQSEKMDRFLAGEYDPDSIRRMLAGMSTTVLPALTENIIRHFIPESVRSADAPFLAAFQDKVLDFCESYTSDIASFLQWWEKKGKTASINSPEDTDAVQIMTVHKSKGLEFKCVIVAYSRQKTHPAATESEWLWVEPDLSEASEAEPIPWLPLESCEGLADTTHSDVYNEYLKKYLTDKINMAYVAYTRAVDELYIYAPCQLKNGVPSEGKGLIGEYLWNCGKNAKEIIGRIQTEYPEAAPYLPKASDFTVDEGSLSWSIGELPTKEEVTAASLSGGERRGGERNLPVATYLIGTPIPALTYSDPSAPEGEILEADAAGDDEESQAEETPQSTEKTSSGESDEKRLRGELMHQIMELLRTPADLPRALLRMKTRGHFDRNTAAELGEEITLALAGVESYGWFAPGQRVLNERGIVSRGRLIRPDRVVIREDGTAAVVDYKFGEHRDDARYSRQVARYARALEATGVASRCDAYIWYVGLGVVVEVGNNRKYDNDRIKKPGS